MNYRLRTHTRQERLFYFLSPIILLTAWELIVASGLVDERFFPRPTVIMIALIEIAASGELLTHITASMVRAILGFVLGGISGIALGVIMGLVKPLRSFLTPLIAFLYPTPKIAILPLMILLFGIGDLSKVLTIAFGVFFLVLINTLVGVLNIAPIYFDFAKNYHLRQLDFYRHVVLPGALPMIFAGARLGMGYALILVVTVEFLGAKAGLGYMIWQAWLTFSLERMFVGLLMIALISILFTFTIDVLARRLVPWFT